MLVSLVSKIQYFILGVKGNLLGALIPHDKAFSPALLGDSDQHISNSEAF